MRTKIMKNAGKLQYLHQILGLFMKKTTFITVMTTIMMMTFTPAFAQEESGEDLLSNGFQKFNMKEDFTENGFQWFRDAQLLCAGNKEKSGEVVNAWKK